MCLPNLNVRQITIFNSLTVFSVRRILFICQTIVFT